MIECAIAVGKVLVTQNLMHYTLAKWDGHYRRVYGRVYIRTQEEPMVRGLRDRRRLIEKVEADGWYLSNVSGSHYQYKHPTKPGKLTIPHHRGDLSIRTVKSVLRIAQLELDDE